MSSLEVDSITRQLSEATVELNKKLSYAGKGLKLDSEDDAKEIEREIRDFKELEILCLEGNTIGVDAAKAIARGLQNHPEFKRALWSDMFTGRMKTEIPPALQHLSDAMMTSGVRLVELDLSDNAFGPNGIKGVQDLLKSETCFTLEVLRLNNNGLGTFGGKILATCLDECYEASCKTGKPMGLKVFVSGRGRLENDGAKNLSVVFKKMGSLEHVAMPQNGIQYPGITELAGAFAHCQKLKHLNLNDNTFTVKGARAMAEALKQMKGLKVINFGDCLIRTDGALLLADSLKNGHSELQEIILCGNEIQKPGGIAIANSLVEKENLTKIELGANNFGDDGVEEIKEILEPLGDILDDLDDDEGSEIEEDEDAQESEDEEEDEEVEVVKTDLTNIVEDPNITCSVVSVGEVEVEERQVSAALEEAIERESSQIAEKIVAQALEAATAQLARENAANTHQDPSCSSKRTSLTRGKGKENAVTSLTSKLRSLSMRSPNKNRDRSNPDNPDSKKQHSENKDCQIL